MSVTVTPPADLLALAEQFATQRRRFNRNRKGRYGADRYNAADRLRVDVEGAQGELAVLHHFTPALRRRGIDPLSVWRGFVDTDPSKIRGDVAGWEVRTSPAAWAKLILHREDADESRFVFVANRLPAFHVLGWILGRDGKAEQYWRGDVPSPAFFVPTSVLHPMPFDPFDDAVRAFIPPPDGLCHRWLDFEQRWCGAEPVGVWQVGPLCEEHSRPARVGAW